MYTNGAGGDGELLEDRLWPWPFNLTFMGIDN